MPAVLSSLFNAVMRSWVVLMGRAFHGRKYRQMVPKRALAATFPSLLDTGPACGHDRRHRHRRRPAMRYPVRTAIAAFVAAAMIAGAHAHSNPSNASALSAVPVAVSVAAPAMLLSAGAMLTVVSVEAGSAGTVWVLERASDGARASVTLGAQAAAGLSLAAGTVVEVSALSAGCG